ncbi:MAG: hypothetical protein M3P96_04085 [Actinomycetota bacterium]|nr:hypothetical protein [Actinomycetota bacterium]
MVDDQHRAPVLVSNGLERGHHPVLIAGLLNRRNEAERWRRDWTTERIKELRSFAADVCEAMDQQYRVIGQCADAARRRRPPVPQDRVVAIDTAWNRLLGRRYVYATEELQNAMMAFDKARAVAVEAVTPDAADAWERAEPELEAGRVAVLDAVQQLHDDINEALASHRLPRRFGRSRLGPPPSAADGD